MRWALQGMGKRGGARAIYYYHNERLPVFLISVYAKNRKANLSKAERNAMKRLVPALVAGYPGKAQEVPYDYENDSQIRREEGDARTENPDRWREHYSRTEGGDRVD
jgi:hypothetical protein